MSIWTDSNPTPEPAVAQRTAAVPEATSAMSPEPSHISDGDTEEALRHYGIKAVPATSFEYGGYRYTNINDAIAQAKRNPGLSA
jgi:hypothetical protein